MPENLRGIFFDSHCILWLTLKGIIAAIYRLREVSCDLFLSYCMTECFATIMFMMI